MITATLIFQDSQHRELHRIICHKFQSVPRVGEVIAFYKSGREIQGEVALVRHTFSERHDFPASISIFILTEKEV